MPPRAGLTDTIIRIRWWTAVAFHLTHMRILMKYAPLMAAALLAFAVPALADDAMAKPGTDKPADDSNTKPTLSTTSGSVTAGGQKINYKANTGTLILKNDKDEPALSMFYVYYAKDGDRKSVV